MGFGNEGQFECGGARGNQQVGFGGRFGGGLLQGQQEAGHGQRPEVRALRARFENRVDTLDLSEMWLSGRRRPGANAEGAD